MKNHKDPNITQLREELSKLEHALKLLIKFSDPDTYFKGGKNKHNALKQQFIDKRNVKIEDLREKIRLKKEEISNMPERDMKKIKAEHLHNLKSSLRRNRNVP